MATFGPGPPCPHPKTGWKPGLRPKLTPKLTLKIAGLLIVNACKD